MTLSAREKKTASGQGCACSKHVQREVALHESVAERAPPNRGLAPRCGDTFPIRSARKTASTAARRGYRRREGVVRQHASSFARVSAVTPRRRKKAGRMSYPPAMGGPSRKSLEAFEDDQPAETGDEGDLTAGLRGHERAIFFRRPLGARRFAPAAATALRARHPLDRIEE